MVVQELREQRWSPRGRLRGHILKSLASKPQVLVALSSTRGQHYFLNHWNFVGKRQKPCGKFAKNFFVFLKWRSLKKTFWRPFFLRWPEKIFEDLFFENTCACVLGLERVCPWPRNFFVSLALCPRLHVWKRERLWNPHKFVSRHFQIYSPTSVTICSDEAHFCLSGMVNKQNFLC